MRSLSLCVCFCVFFLVLKVTEEEMDLCAIMHKSAEPSSNLLIVEAEMEVNSTVGTLRRKIVNRVKDTISMLYKCIGYILEYYIQAVITINRTWKN